MKTTITFLLCFVFAISAMADDAKFKEAMRKNITALYAAQNIEDLQKTVNVFDRIGNAEKNHWEPFYYSAFNYVQLALKENEGTKKDAWLDEAQASFEKASALKADDSEIITIGAFIKLIRISVDPATRGQQYSGQVLQTLGKALAINPANPRAMGMKAQMQFGMAKFFGQTPTEACANALQAQTLLAAEKPSDVLGPRWGKYLIVDVLNQCK